MLLIKNYSYDSFVKAIACNALIKGAQYIYSYARSAFVDSELRLKIWPGKHVFTKEIHEQAYELLDRYLK